MKIIFMGTAAFAVPSLAALHSAGHKVALVITQPDKPAGRGMKMLSPPVAMEAKRLGFELYQPKSVKSTNVIEHIRSFEPDMIAIVAYGKILPAELLKIPKLGSVNVHSSLLPKYRGAAPMNWAIVNGEKETGVTTMFINESLDAGDTLLKKSVKIDNDDTAITLHDKLAPIGAELLIETLDDLKKGTIRPEPQDHSAATFAPIIKKEDGRIDWTKDAESIRNLIRGMQPWPSAHTYLDGKMLKIFKATVLNASSQEKAGTIHVTSDSIVVITGKDKLCINELQLEGKKRMTAHDFLNGHKIRSGVVLDC